MSVFFFSAYHITSFVVDTKVNIQPQLSPGDTTHRKCTAWPGKEKYKNKNDQTQRNRIIPRLDFRRFLESGLRSPREVLSGVSAGSIPEQRLVLEPKLYPQLTNSDVDFRFRLFHLCKLAF